MLEFFRRATGSINQLLSAYAAQLRGNLEVFMAFHRLLAEEMLMKKAIMSLVALSFICGISLSLTAAAPASACWWKDRHYQP